MKYLNEWKKAKEVGKFPEGGPDPETSMDGKSTLLHVLKVMAKKAQVALEKGEIDTGFGVTITAESLKERKFWLVAADETPSCDTVPTYENGDDEAIEVKHLAAIKIPLSN